MLHPKADGTDVAPVTPAGWITARAGNKKKHLIRKGNKICKFWQCSVLHSMFFTNNVEEFV
jgi:hypothetical protein